MFWLSNFIWYFVGNNLRIIFPFKILEIKKKGISVVKRDFRLCLEGYPRSGNTFLFSALSLVTDSSKIGHHLHNIAHLKEAISLQVPVVFIIRGPTDAIASYVIREQIPLKLAFIQYLQLYSYVLKRADKIEIIDFNAVIEKSNVLDKLMTNIFGTNIRLSEVDDEKIRNKVDHMDQVDQGTSSPNSLKGGRPFSERHELAKSLKDRIVKEFATELNKCDKLYTTLLSKVLRG